VVVGCGLADERVPAGATCANSDIGSVALKQGCGQSTVFRVLRELGVLGVGALGGCPYALQNWVELAGRASISNVLVSRLSR
jgi:hypothetical protein